MASDLLSTSIRCRTQKKSYVKRAHIRANLIELVSNHPNVDWRFHQFGYSIQFFLPPRCLFEFFQFSINWSAHPIAGTKKILLVLAEIVELTFHKAFFIQRLIILKVVLSKQISSTKQEQRLTLEVVSWRKIGAQIGNQPFANIGTQLSNHFCKNQVCSRRPLEVALSLALHRIAINSAL